MLTVDILVGPRSGGYQLQCHGVVSARSKLCIYPIQLQRHYDSSTDSYGTSSARVLVQYLYGRPAWTVNTDTTTMADPEKDELGFESSAFEALERDFQEVTDLSRHHHLYMTIFT